MKRIIALLLAVLMMVSVFAACAPTPDPEPTPDPTPTPDPAPTPDPEPTPDPVELAKFAFMNTALDDLELSKDEEARFNADWLPGYPVADYVANNFWFVPADDVMVAQTSYEDGYALETEYADFVNQIISIDVTEEMAPNYEVVVCGPESQKDYFPYHVGYILAGNEAILFMNEDGYDTQYLFEDINMAAAEEYDFVCADGYTETIHKDDLAEIRIFRTENGTIDSNSAAYPEYTLSNIQYITPADQEKDAELEAGVIYKLNIFENSVGVMGVEPPVEGYWGGKMVNAYKIAELLEAVELAEGTTVKYVSYKDGATKDEDYALFAQKYITVDVDDKDRQPWTVGKAQAKNDYLANIGYVLWENTGLVYIPTTYTEDAGMALTDLLAALGYAEATACQLVCSDGFAETIQAADYSKVTVYCNDGVVDGTSVAYAGSALMGLMYIVPMG